MDNDTDMYRYIASIHARMASEYFHSAHDVREYDEGRARFSMKLAEEQLAKVANILGFDLVKRTQKQEAA